MALKKINYNGQSKIILRLCEMVNQLIDGGGGGGSTVAYTQTLSSGTKTGEISIDGVSTDMYAPTQPTALSDLTNDEGFINNTVNNLTNYYLKTETYTQSEVDALISAIVTLNILVVQTLPTQDISTTTIYLVPKQTAETQDIYDEYIYVNNAWELIGTTQIDLSNYYTKTETDALLANKVDKVAGKQLSTEDFTSALKTKLDGIASGAEVNVQSDWNQSDSSADDFIKNKPSIPTALSDLTDDSTHRLVTDTEKSTWNGKSDFSGSYNDLTDKPTIPTVNNGTLTIKKGSTTLGTFTANQSGNSEVVIPESPIDINTETPTFTEASIRTNIASGETISTLFGKIKKFFTDLKAVAFSGSYNDLSDQPTIPDISTKVSKSGDTMSGCLRIDSTQNDFREGIRINAASNGYCTFLIGGANGSTSGTSDCAFWIGTNVQNSSYKRKLYIAHNASTQSDTYFHASSSSDKSPKLHLPSGSIANQDYDAVNGDAVYGYIASGNSGRDEHNANNAIKNGVYYYTSNGPSTSLGASTNDGALFVQRHSDSWVTQIAQDYRNGRMFVRGKKDGTWQPWLRVALYSEIPETSGFHYKKLSSGSSTTISFLFKNSTSAGFVHIIGDENGTPANFTIALHTGSGSTTPSASGDYRVAPAPIMMFDTSKWGLSVTVGTWANVWVETPYEFYE